MPTETQLELIKEIVDANLTKSQIKELTLIVRALLNKQNK